MSCTPFSSLKAPSRCVLHPIAKLRGFVLQNLLLHPSKKIMASTYFVYGILIGRSDEHYPNVAYEDTVWAISHTESGLKIHLSFVALLSSVCNPSSRRAEKPCNLAALLSGVSKSFPEES